MSCLTFNTWVLRLVLVPWTSTSFDSKKLICYKTWPIIKHLFVLSMYILLGLPGFRRQKWLYCQETDSKLVPNSCWWVGNESPLASKIFPTYKCSMWSSQYVLYSCSWKAPHTANSPFFFFGPSKEKKKMHVLL